MRLKGKTEGLFLGVRGKERASVLIKRGRKICLIKAGDMFCRKRADQTLELARVIALSADSFSIPHIRYEIEFKHPHRTNSFIEGPRVLSLGTFADMYKDRLAA